MFIGHRMPRVTDEQAGATFSVDDPGGADLAPARADQRDRRRSKMRTAIGRHPVWASLAVLALLLVSAAFSAQATDVDSGYDLLGLLRAVATDAARLRWQFAAAAVVLAALHYLATAVAARAAAGTPLRLGETVLVQLAAAAANRLTVRPCTGFPPFRP